MSQIEDTTEPTAPASYYVGAYPQTTQAGTTAYGTIWGPYASLLEAAAVLSDEAEAETEISRQGMCLLVRAGEGYAPADEEEIAALDPEAVQARVDEIRAERSGNPLLALIGGWNPDTNSAEDLRDALRGLRERADDPDDDSLSPEDLQAAEDQGLTDLPLPSSLPAGIRRVVDYFSGRPLWTVDSRGYALTGDTADDVEPLVDMTGAELEFAPRTACLAELLRAWTDEDWGWIERAAHDEYEMRDLREMSA
jgi:hypothetical protein